MLRFFVAGFLVALSGCAAPSESIEGDPIDSIGGKADDARQVELSELAGRYTLVTADNQLVPDSTLSIAVEGDKARAQRIERGTAVGLFASTLGAEPEIETYTVATSGFLGGSWSERRKIVESFTRVAPDAFEYRRDMYSWVVSYRVWEEWQLYGTVVERITLGPNGVTLRSIDTRYDDDETREYLVTE